MEFDNSEANKMNYKYYLFDFDYTMVNSEKGIVGCFLLTMEDFGIQPPDYNTIKATIGMPIEEAIADLTGLDQEGVAAFTARYKVHANEIMTSNTHFYPDTVAVLKKIKAHGGKVGIVSTKTRHRIMEKFQWEGLEQLVDVVIGREDAETCKPDPEGILIAMDRLGAEKSNTIYIGDSLYDAGGAENAGIDFAAVLTGYTEADKFAQYPSVQIIESLSELK